MPPRKRAETKPAESDETTPATPDQDAPGHEAPAPATEEPKSGGEPKTATKRKPHADPQPCTECFPGGWPEDSTGLGCEHGTWNRDNT